MDRFATLADLKRRAQGSDLVSGGGKFGAVFGLALFKGAGTDATPLRQACSRQSRLWRR